MSLLGYKMLAPLLLPLIEKDAQATELISYSILFDRVNNTLTQEVTDKNGSREFAGTFDPEKLFNSGIGNIAKKRINKEAPESALILFSIDKIKRETEITYFDNNNKIIRNTIYK
jgi:hypothetical protein